ncbi:MAG: trehalase family glycosidase [Saprospiraceae bacterium]|nr:trehalase family glycosidase [Saprospiraceae bacterium]
MTLQSRAKDVLLGNWMGSFTIPTKKLYPFQWNWDSGFSSLGVSHFNLEYCMQELNSLFTGQWQNGMLPHIIFHSENEKSYFPNHDFWNSAVNIGAPEYPKTSGITQPPVQGFILEELVSRYPKNEKLIEFAKSIYPKILANHRYFYTYRDPNKEGLTFIYHPWESGRDNSPIWDTSMERIEVDPEQLPKYKRRDTSITDADERPTSFQYDRYVYLLELGKKFKYDEPGIFEKSPFLIQDTLMNSVLIKSNQSLINLSKKFGFDTGEVEEWQQQAIPAFREKLWSEELQTFVSYDLREEKKITHKEIGGTAVLFSDIPTTKQANLINDYLVSLNERGFYTCPSFDVDSPLFDSKRYWRGPIWPQMNWLVYKGLLHHGFLETAQMVKNDLITLVDMHGFHEYFESQKSVAKTLQKGYGGGNFSWTAACVLDMLERGNQ